MPHRQPHAEERSGEDGGRLEARTLSMQRDFAQSLGSAHQRTT